MLGNVAQQPEHVDTVVTAGAIALCIALLQNDNNEPKANAAWVLSCISEYERHTETIVAAGTIGICFDMLQSDVTEHAKQNVTWVLACISGFEQHVEAVMTGDRVENLLKMLPSMLRDAQFNTASALACISNRLDAVSTASIVTPLIRAMHRTAEDKAQAALALSRILRYGQNPQVVVANGAGVETALIQVQQDGNELAKGHASAALKAFLLHKSPRP